MKVSMIKKQVRPVKIHAENPLNPPKPLKSITNNNVKKLTADIGKLSISKKQPVKKSKKESSDKESSDEESSDEESSDDESSDDESSDDESSDDESSDDESSDDESSDDESSKNATKIIKNKVIVNSKKPIVKLQTKRKFDESTSKQVKEIITKTGNLVIEKQKSLKKVKLENDSLKKEWENPSLDYPIIDKELRIVENIKTKYVSFINYNFTGKPAYCKYWNSQFSKNCEKNIFEKHWDLLPVFWLVPD
jgi:hypothetical protein